MVLFKLLPRECAPAEDRQRVAIIVTAPEGSSLQYIDRYLRQVEQVAMEEMEAGNVRTMLTRTGNFGGGGDVNMGRVIMALELLGRAHGIGAADRGAAAAQAAGFAGVRVVVATPGGLGIRGVGTPVQIVLGGGDYEELARWRDIDAREGRRESRARRTWTRTSTRASRSSESRSIAIAPRTSACR